MEGQSDRTWPGASWPDVPAGWSQDDALPIHGWTHVDMPCDELWSVFTNVARWPEWNPCMRWARVSEGRLSTGATLTWVFNPIRRWYPYLLPARATIESVDERRRVTWEVRFPGFHALHSYLFDDAPLGARFGSWEIAEGSMYRLLRPFWLAHFRFVRDASLAGARQAVRNRPQLVEFGTDTTRSPIVVIPGIDGQAGSVAPIVRQLAEHRRVLLVDYTLEAEASLEALAEKIGAMLPDSFDVVGQSIGTWLAIEVALRRSEAVRRVVLIATFTRTRTWPLRVSAFITRWLPRRLYRAMTPALMAVTCGPIGDGKTHPFLRTVGSSHQRSVAKRTRWQIGRDMSTRMRLIGKPALVLLGASDRFVPRRKREFARIRSIFTGSDDRVVVIPRAGHVMLPSAAIDLAATETLAFLDG